MVRKTVDSQHEPRAIGSYSHAVWGDNLLFLSGQLPIDPVTMKLTDDDIAVQT